MPVTKKRKQNRYNSKRKSKYYKSKNKRRTSKRNTRRRRKSKNRLLIKSRRQRGGSGSGARTNASVSPKLYFQYSISGDQIFINDTYFTETTDPTEDDIHDYLEFALLYDTDELYQLMTQIHLCDNNGVVIPGKGIMIGNKDLLDYLTDFRKIVEILLDKPIKTKMEELKNLFVQFVQDGIFGDEVVNVAQNEYTKLTKNPGLTTGNGTKVPKSLATGHNAPAAFSLTAMSATKLIEPRAGGYRKQFGGSGNPKKGMLGFIRNLLEKAPDKRTVSAGLDEQTHLTGLRFVGDGDKIPKQIGGFPCIWYGVKPGYTLENCPKNRCERIANQCKPIPSRVMVKKLGPPAPQPARPAPQPARPATQPPQRPAPPPPPRRPAPQTPRRPAPPPPPTIKEIIDRRDARAKQVQMFFPEFDSTRRIKVHFELDIQQREITRGQRMEEWKTELVRIETELRTSAEGQSKSQILSEQQKYLQKKIKKYEDLQPTRDPHRSEEWKLKSSLNSDLEQIRAYQRANLEEEIESELGFTIGRDASVVLNPSNKISKHCISFTDINGYDWVVAAVPNIPGKLISAHLSSDVLSTLNDFCCEVYRATYLNKEVPRSTPDEPDNTLVIERDGKPHYLVFPDFFNLTLLRTQTNENTKRTLSRQTVSFSLVNLPKQPERLTPLESLLTSPYIDEGLQSSSNTNINDVYIRVCLIHILNLYLHTKIALWSVTIKDFFVNKEDLSVKLAHSLMLSHMTLHEVNIFYEILTGESENLNEFEKEDAMKQKVFLVAQQLKDVTTLGILSHNYSLLNKYLTGKSDDGPLSFNTVTQTVEIKAIGPYTLDATGPDYNKLIYSNAEVTFELVRLFIKKYQNEKLNFDNETIRKLVFGTDTEIDEFILGQDFYKNELIILVNLIRDDKVISFIVLVHSFGEFLLECRETYQIRLSDLFISVLESDTFTALKEWIRQLYYVFKDTTPKQGSNISYISILRTLDDRPLNYGLALVQKLVTEIEAK